MTAETQLAFDTAIMLMRAGKRDEAARACWEILRRDPKHADAWAMRARIEAESGRYENAMLHHGLAIQAEGNRFDLWCNRGIDAMQGRMLKEAEESFQRSLALKETYEAHNNYANLLCMMMRVDESVKHYEAALALDDNVNEQIHANVGIAMIAQGRWHEGFQHYRHRFASPNFPPHPRFGWPHWTGQKLEGKVIMLYAEQGFGDEIMALRFVKPIKDLGATVILAVRPHTFRLARSLGLADHIILMYDPCPVEPDYMCALIDVPAFLDITPETVPLKGGYLAADDRGFRLSFKPGIRVGICWASGKRDLQPMFAETAKQKSLSFRHMAELARPGVSLVNLQQHHTDQAAMRDLDILDPMPGVTDFADTAFMISHLDLVVTVDTSVAHLAGAMGVPTWNFVRFDGLWPWGQDKKTTCWYDSMTIFRQSRPFDWSEPYNLMMAAFERFVAQRQAA